MPWVDGSYLVSIHTCTDSGAIRSWLFNHEDVTQSQYQSKCELEQLLFSADRLVAHNIKFDLLWLQELGIDINKLPSVYCTQVVEYLLRGQHIKRGELTLENLSIEYGIAPKIDKVKLYWESGYETDEIPSSILVPYGEQDAINTLAIYERQVPKILQRNMQALCTMQCEMSRVLSQIEYNGLLVNRLQLEEYSTQYELELQTIEQKLMDIVYTYAGVKNATVNLGSDHDLSAILYGGNIKYDGTETTYRTLVSGAVKVGSRKCTLVEQIQGLGFTPLKKTETARDGIYKTDMDTLRNLKTGGDSYKKEFIQLIIERSRLTKLKSTYFDGLLDKVMTDDRVHPSMNQCITSTGRLSSSNPKLIGVVKPCEFRGTPYGSILSEANTYLLVRRTRWNIMYVIIISI